MLQFKHDPLTQFVVDQQHVNPVLGWSPCADLEYQVNGAEREYRNVLNGSTDPELKSNIPDWIPDQVILLGCSGWNPVDLVSEWGGIDLDAVAGHATTGLSPERLAEYVAAISKLPYCQVQRSKSGDGYHVFFRWDESDRPRAFTRSDHKRNCKRVVMQIQKDIGMDLLSDADVYGGNMWLWWSQRNG